MTKPRYQDIEPEAIPVVELPDGIKVKVLAGSFNGTEGPVSAVATEPLYLDISLVAETSLTVPLPAQHNAFAYPFEGGVTIGEGAAARAIARGEIAVLGLGGQVRIAADKGAARLILVAGKPLREPVAK